LNGLALSQYEDYPQQYEDYPQRAQTSTDALGAVDQALTRQRDRIRQSAENLTEAA
jgi:hypothetical protein